MCWKDYWKVHVYKPISKDFFNDSIWTKYRQISIKNVAYKEITKISLKANWRSERVNEYASGIV